MPDYYTLLEVSPKATTAEIKRSYRRLARLHHPDLNQQARDNHIKRLNEAYEVLRDPVKRAKYDAQRLEEAQRATAQAAMRKQQEQKIREAEMTWIQGIFGFVRELKKGLKEYTLPSRSRHSPRQCSHHQATMLRCVSNCYNHHQQRKRCP
jgi:curved DNA-binding protein CbpA